MNLRVIKANMTELELKDGTLILFSYQTPVAVAYRMSDKYYRVTGTGKFWSVTTSRHINQWIKQMADSKIVVDRLEPIEQSKLDSLVQSH